MDLNLETCHVCQDMVEKLLDEINELQANCDKLEKKNVTLQKKCNNYARKQKESLSHTNIFKEIQDIDIEDTMVSEYNIRDYICSREYYYNLIPLLRMFQRDMIKNNEEADYNGNDYAYFTCKPCFINDYECMKVIFFNIYMGNNLIDEETICPKTMETVFECCCKNCLEVQRYYG